MAIRWSPLMVSNSMDKVSKQLDGAETFFKMAKDLVKEAENISNIPGYVKQYLFSLNQELGRIQDMRRAVQRVRDSLPKEELAKNRATGVIDRPKLIG